MAADKSVDAEGAEKNKKKIGRRANWRSGACTWVTGERHRTLNAFHFVPIFSAFFLAFLCALCVNALIA